MRVHGADLLAVSMVTGLVGGAEARAQPVLYENPRADRITVRTVTTPSPGEVDLYYPPSRGSADALPAVVFVLAYPDTTRFGPLRDLEPYPSWARLVAAEGVVGVLYETRSPVDDLIGLMAFLADESRRLGIDPARVALWSASGNTALALKYARVPGDIRPAALVAYYGIMPTPDDHQGAAIDSISERFGVVMPDHAPSETYPSGFPVFVVRAGRDNWSEILGSIDHFVPYALREGLALTLRNHPTGSHGFDFQDDTPETRRVIRETLHFLRTRLDG